MRRFVFVTIIGSVALIATAGVALDYFERPTILRVAVPRDSDDQAILAAATRSFAESREDTRLKVVTVGDLAQSAHALEEGHADLAVVRSDLAMPPRGQTVLIMRRNAALLMAPAQSGLHEIEELRGQRIGVLQGPSAGKGDNPLGLDSVLAQYDVPVNAVQRVFLTASEVSRALL